MKSIGIIGAGLTGSVIARQFAEEGFKVILYEKESYVGGQCRDIKEKDNYMSFYGPHIFYTSDKEVWSYVNKFTEFTTYKHEVNTYYQEKELPWPINLNTMRYFFGQKDDSELKNIINFEIENEKKMGCKMGESFENNALLLCGRTLYEALIKPYTQKMWNTEPKNLSSELCSRIPIKFAEDNYFSSDKYQGMPINGFSKLIENIVDHKNISLRLGCQIGYNNVDSLRFKHTMLVSTANIGDYFADELLPYNGLMFVIGENTFDKYETSVVNFPELNYRAIRRTDYSKFYGLSKPVTIYEFPKSENIVQVLPLYPIPIKEYEKRAQKLIKKLKSSGIYSLGRLGTYKYLNMDQAIKQALNFSKKFI